MTATLLDARNCLDICGLLCETGSEHFNVFHTSEVYEVIQNQEIVQLFSEEGCLLFKTLSTMVD
jgi:hypothetical protein